MDFHEKVWKDWDQYNETQSKKPVHRVMALDLMVKQRKSDDSGNVRKSSKPKVSCFGWKCKSCKGDMYKGQNTCMSCGTVSEESFLQDPSVDDVRYKSEFMHYSNIPCVYKRMNHFSEKLSQIQGKERTQIDNDIYNAIREEIQKMNMPLTSITPRIVKIILKKLNKAKYYEHCNMITKNLNGYNLPHFTQVQEEKLKEMFNMIQKPFERHSPPGRKNFLNYAYIFRKFLELLSYDEFLPFFSELKSREKLYQQDEHWKKICSDLNWEFIPSV